MMKILSGIQPSQTLHIGNYFGAIKQWMVLQNQYQCIFFIADLHSLTSNTYDNINIYDKSLEVLATYMACGLNPEKNIFFLQSDNFHHTYFYWILSTITYLGEVNRMVQMKDKSQQYNNVGILTYPILMAADILLYNPLYVPVGEDQYQHLELARDLAKRLNFLLKKDLFLLPKPFTNHNLPRKIYDLTDGSKKMSKTNVKGCLFLLDSDEIITSKISKAKSDNFLMPMDNEDYSHRLEITNLINIYSCFADISTQEVVHQYQGQPIAIFKKQLINLAIEKITPIRSKILNLINDKKYLEEILGKGKIWAINECNKILKPINNYFLGKSM